MRSFCSGNVSQSAAAKLGRRIETKGFSNELLGAHDPDLVPDWPGVTVLGKARTVIVRVRVGEARWVASECWRQPSSQHAVHHGAIGVELGLTKKMSTRGPQS